MGVSGENCPPPPPLQFESDDVLCSAPVKTINFSLAPSALALNNTSFWSKVSKICEMLHFCRRRAQKTVDFAILTCIEIEIVQKNCLLTFDRKKENKNFD